MVNESHLTWHEVYLLKSCKMLLILTVQENDNANKRASVAEDSGDHKEIIDLVSRQNIDVEGEISVNIDGEVVKSEFAHIVEGIPTEKNEDKTDVETGHTRPVEKLICNDTESGVKVNDNKEEDPSLNNEEYGGDKRAGLASFEHMDSEDHSEGNDSALSDSQRREVAQVSRLGACRPLSVIAQETDKRKIDNLPAPALPAIISSRSSEGHSQTTGSKFTQIPSADLSRQEDYSQTTDLYPNRSTDHHSSACLQKCNDTKKEVAPSEIRSASEASLWDDPRTPGIVNIREIDHYTQKEVAALKEEAERNSGGGNQAPENNEAAPAVPSEEDSDVIAVSGIKKREVTYCGKKWMISEPISDRKMGLKWCLNVSQNHPCFQNNEIPVFVIPLLPRQTYIEFQGAVPVSDDGDQITFESEADTYANRLLGYTTDPLTIIDQTAFEIDNLRLGGPVSLIEQDNEQQTTCIHPLRMAQNESLVDEEQSPSETGSTSRELCNLSDTHGTPELCHIRMADHNHSSPQLTSTGTQNDVAALKEPKEVNATKNPITVSAHDETNEESATMYPAYKDNHTRRVSFKESSNNVQNTTKMADCGFFYAGFGDCVCCFHCGVELQHWQGEDDPWIEHVRYSPECRYVRMMKGDKFISLVKMAVKREEAERNSGGGNQAPENNEAAPAVPSEEGHKITGNTKSEQSQKDPQKIKREHRELRDDTLCKICMENTISVVFLPCGHRVTCPDCAPAMRKCPICGTLIKGIVKTFYG